MNEICPHLAGDQVVFADKTPKKMGEYTNVQMTNVQLQGGHADAQALVRGYCVETLGTELNDA